MEAARVQAAHRRLLDSLDRPEETQRELLTRILEHNAGTAFRHEHGLSASVPSASCAGRCRSAPMRS
ncbi:hypothetical protein STENM327S_06227 [Streptomyces tendae]